MKTLVAYYSFSGNTKETAEKIASQIGADMLEIKAVKDIPSDNDFKKFMLGGMKASMELKAKIEHEQINISDYDRIVLGTPVWAGKPVPAINAFVVEQGVAEKVTAVFTCSGGGNNERCIKTLQKNLKGILNTVSIIDKTTPELSDKNDEKISQFVEKLNA